MERGFNVQETVIVYTTNELAASQSLMTAPWKFPNADNPFHLDSLRARQNNSII